jgi:hypothetical protein
VVEQLGGREGGTEEEGAKEGEREEFCFGWPGGEEGAEEEGGEGGREGGEGLEDYGYSSFEQGNVVRGEEGGLAFLPFLGSSNSSSSSGEAFELRDDGADGLFESSRGVDG